MKKMQHKAVSYDLSIAGSLYQDAGDALYNFGLWFDGWPARLFCVEEDQQKSKEIIDVYSVIEKITFDKINYLGESFCFDLIKEQIIWYEALKRPQIDKEAIEACLREGLKIKEIENCKLKEFKSEKEVWDRRNYAWFGWNKWSPIIPYFDLKDFLGAQFYTFSWNLWQSVVTAPNISNILIHYSLAKLKKIDSDPHLYTTGIRDAYKNGLAYVAPVAKQILGWASTNGGE